MECRITLGDGTTISATPGETLEDIIRRAYPEKYRLFLAAQLDGEIVDLSSRVEQDHTVVFFPFGHPEGRRTYIRSLLFLLSYAVSQVLPGKRLRVLHSMSDGLFCEVEGAEHNLSDLLETIEKVMRETIAQDLPIEREVVNWEKAIHIYTRRGREDVVRLFRYLRTPAVPLYRLGDFYDHYYGPLCPRTGYLTSFGFVVVPPGFIVQFPKDDTGKLPPYVFRPKLFSAFKEAAQWGKIMNIENVGELNEAIARGEGKEIIAIAEALHEKKIAQIADLITQRKGSLKLVLIAGPSSSGKTTFTRRLYTQLRVNGWKPITISLDDYFLSRHELQGSVQDYESPEALDLELFKEQLLLLVAGKEVEIPRYNFITGTREPRGIRSRLEKDGVILVEGLHALNPRLSQDIPEEEKFKIYVSALTTLNIDDHNRIPTTDCRLIRRIVRDSQFRGSKAEEVFATWPKVRAGEEKYIFPYQEEADVMFNSSLIYEFCILRQYAEALLRAITPESPSYLEAYRLYSFLNHFMLLNPSFVPSNSILREFIG
uniref:Nucleoside kinase n=1 Tax=Candidatus Caldatribacterium californiense TaxID=1454726 RepID=A0A7V4DE12_9BACT